MSDPPPIPAEVSDEENNTPTQPNDNEIEENLLIPLRTASEQSSLSSDNEQMNIKCLDCRYVARTAFALKMHRQSQHSVRPLSLIIYELSNEINILIYTRFLDGEEKEEEANDATILR